MTAADDGRRPFGHPDRVLCGAHARTTGQPCRAVAMANGRCRMHGGKGSGAPRGNTNNFIHGRRSAAAQERQRKAAAAELELLAKIDEIAAKAGLASPERRRKRDGAKTQEAQKTDETTEVNRKVKHRFALVQSLIDRALAKRRAGNFDYDEAMADFDEVRAMAMAMRAPTAAARCIWYMAQLAGLFVQRSAIAIAPGSPAEFSLQGDIAERRRELLDQLAEKHGTQGAQRLLQVLDEVRSGIIDGKAEDPEAA